MSRWKFLDVKLARVTVRITALMENNCSTAAERGKGGVVLNNTFPQICQYIEP